MHIIAFSIAAVMVIASVLLEIIEQKDRQKGIPVKHRDYTIWGMICLIIKDSAHKIKSRFGRKPK